MKNKKKCTAILLGLLIVAGSAFGLEMTLGTTDDAMVVGGAPGGNYGSATSMRIRWQNDADWGRIYPLAKFDISALPNNIVVNWVRLRFYVALADDAGAGWPAADDFPMVEMYNNLSDWDEGSVTFNTKPTIDAAAAETLDHFGLLGVDDVSFVSPNTISSGGWLEYVGAGTIALVSGWVDGTIPNYGVTIMGSGAYTDTSRYFDLQTKDNPAGAVHPALIVDYTVIPEPATFGLIGCLAALFIARKR